MIAPSAWACPPSYYNATDGCDCNCGVLDPDCAVPNQELFNCPCQNMTCNTGGFCVGLCNGYELTVVKSISVPVQPGGLVLIYFIILLVVG